MFRVFDAYSSIAGVMHVCVIIFNVREDIKGRAEGELNVSAVNVGLKAELQKLSTECAKGSDLEVNYYSTGLPDKLPINIEGLTDLIENFPSRMKDINAGKGIPVTVRILFVSLNHKRTSDDREQNQQVGTRVNSYNLFLIMLMRRQYCLMASFGSHRQFTLESTALFQNKW